MKESLGKEGLPALADLIPPLQVSIRRIENETTRNRPVVTDRDRL
jgi:hypothetical protein